MTELLKIELEVAKELSQRAEEYRKREQLPETGDKVNIKLPNKIEI